MVHPLVFVGLGLLAGEIYRRYATGEEKERWENFVSSHHGEWGILALILGATTGHYGMAATGAGLALHDINDIENWFTNNNKEYSK